MDQESLNNHYKALAQHYDKVTMTSYPEYHLSPSLMSGVHHQGDSPGWQEGLHCHGGAGGASHSQEPQTKT